MRMKKRFFSMLLCIVLCLSLMPMSAFAAVMSLEEVRITGISEVSGGDLPAIDVSLVSENATIDADATIWLSKKLYEGWFPFSGTPSAVNDGSTQYAMRLCVKPNAGYEITDETVFYYNGTIVPSSRIGLEDGAAYVVIELGKAIGGGPGNYPLLFVNNVRITAENKDDVLGDGKVSYNPFTTTITFSEEVELTAPHNNGLIYGRLNSSSETLNIIAHNGLKLTNKTPYASGIYMDTGNLSVQGNITADVYDRGIFADGDVTISGSGDLTIDTIHGSGISSVNGDIIIDGYGDVTINANDDGVLAYSGKVIISGNGTTSIISKTKRAVYKNLELSGTGKTITLQAGGSNKAVFGTVSGTNLDNYNVTGDPASTSVVYTLKEGIHSHSYVDVVTNPTCTEKGYTTHTCDCGDSYVDTYTTAAGHTYGEWAITKEPTETETGSKERTCSACGNKDTGIIPVLEHIHNVALQNGTAATCTTAGFKDYYTCSCGLAFEDATCNIEIVDLDAWKAEGGNGYIAPTGHGETEPSETEPSATEPSVTEPSVTEPSVTETEAETTTTATETAATTTGVSILYGDANNDGAVNMKDVLMLRQYIADMEIAIERINLTNADVTANGYVDMKDVLMLRKFLAGLVDKLSA